VSDLHIDVSRKGGSPLTWDSRCEQHGQRWWIQLGFASAGAIELECNEAQLDYHAG
jgi:hypothetical protein